MHIEVVEPGELNTERMEGLLELVVQQMRFIGYEYTQGEALAIVKHALRAGSRAILFVGTGEDGQVISFAFGNRCCGLECGGDYLWLNELYVLPQMRKGGIGSSMLTFVREWAKEHGCVYMALVTHPKNTNAINFYEGMGMETEPLVWVDRYL
ncbi:MAG: GNAT family N-acetyltransferase [Sphaerochaetaceae bacterium]